jgi:hypothetical protein
VITKLVGQTLKARGPAELKRAVDELDRQRAALTAAAPSEIRGDHRVFDAAWRRQREAAERRGWSAAAYFKSAPAVLTEEYAAAAGHHLGWVYRHCGA